MDPNSFPTKGNLILAKRSLTLAKQGFELMDKKRNILIHELMEQIEVAKNIQSEIDITFTAAYKALQKANVEIGISQVEQISYTVPIEESINVKYRSVMGVEIPIVTYEPTSEAPPYSLIDTTSTLDEAYHNFKKVKELTLRLAMIENTAYRLAMNIKKTQRRANALKNITIPRYKDLTAFIQSALEEKDREEFTRLKVVKKRK